MVPQSRTWRYYRKQ